MGFGKRTRPATQRTTIQRGDALAFLRAVTPAIGNGTLLAFHADDGPRGGCSYDINDLAKTAKFIAAHKGENLYWTPNTVRKGVNKKPAKADITEMRWVHLDYDFKDGDTRESVLAKIQTYRLPPSIILFSGGGYHVYWKLKKPIPIDGGNEAEVAKLEVANRQVMQHFGAGKGTHNLDRILRLPATRNFPNAKKRAKGRVPVGTELLELNLERNYSLADFTDTDELARAAQEDVQREEANQDQSANLWREAHEYVRKGVRDRSDLEKLLGDHPHVTKFGKAKERARALTRAIDKALANVPKAVEASLPEALRNLMPNCAAWLTEDPPLPVYILAPYLQAGETAMVAGQAGTSKSTWTMFAAASMAGGVPFFGVVNTIERPYRVMYCMLERTQASFQRRWRKIVNSIGDGITATGDRKKFYANLRGMYTAKALAGQSVNLIECKNQQWVQTAVVAELIAALKAASIEVLFLDPLSRLHGGEEDGATLNALTKAFERIVQETGCSIVFVHHAGKDASALGGKYAGRGSSVLTDNTSETIAFAEYKPDDRGKLGDLSSLLPGEEADDIIRVDHTRCSDGRLAPPAYFVRAQKTGLLRPITIRHKEAGDQLQDLITGNEQFHRWAVDRQFTLTELVKERGTAFPGKVSEKKVKALFDEAVKTNTFRQNGSRNGFPLYEWKPDKDPKDVECGSAVRHSRATAPLKKQGQIHAR